jgi:C1A family cysteine protease
MRRLLYSLIFLPWIANSQDPISTGLENPCDEEINRYVTPGAIVFSSSSLVPPSIVDLSDFLPAIGNQGVQGSCTAFAVAGALTILTHQRNNRKFSRSLQEFNHFVSPSFIFNIGKSKYPYPRSENCRDGISYIDAFLVVRDNGAVYWPLSQYNPSGNGGCLSKYYPSDKALKTAKETKILTFQKPDLDLNLLKGLLSEQPGYPICIAVNIDTEYQRAINKENNSTWLKKGNPIPGQTNNRHALLIVGYDDSRRCFKVLDSRGSEKGDNGFIWMSYDLLLNRTIYDAYVCSFDDRLLKTQKSQGKEEEIQLGTTIPTYLKEGYFRIFNGIKIGCLDIDKKNNLVRFRVSNSYTGRHISDLTLSLYQQKNLIIDSKTFSIFTKEFSQKDGHNPMRSSIRFDLSLQKGELVEEVVESGLFRETLNNLFLWTFIEESKYSIQKYHYIGSIPEMDRSIVGSYLDSRNRILLEFPDSIKSNKPEIFYYNEPFTTTRSGQTRFELFSLRNFLKVMSEFNKINIDSGSLSSYSELIKSIASKEIFSINSWTWQINGVRPDKFAEFVYSDRGQFANQVNTILSNSSAFLVQQSYDLVGFTGSIKLTNDLSEQTKNNLLKGAHISVNNGTSFIDITKSETENTIQISWQGNLSVFALTIPD